jgi:hypothetical protein
MLGCADTGFVVMNAIALNAAISGSILAEGCKSRALLPLDVIGAKSGDMRPEGSKN